MGVPVTDLVDPGTWGTWGYLGLRNACFPISMEMLQYVGCGVAMGNALPEVKELADEITLTNEEDGIYVCLKEKGIIA